MLIDALSFYRFQLIRVSVYFMCFVFCHSAHAQSEGLQSKFKVGTGFPGNKPLEMLGFYPGMPFLDAEKLLVRYQSENRLQRVDWRKTQLGENKPYVWVERGGYVLFSGNVRDVDRISTWFSGPLGENQLLSAVRNSVYRVERQPDFQATHKAIIGKYGIPSYEESNSGSLNYKWIFIDGNQIKDKNSDPCPRNSNVPKLDSALGDALPAEMNKSSDDFLMQNISNYESKGNCGIVIYFNLILNDEKTRVTSMLSSVTDYNRIANYIARIKAAPKEETERIKSAPPAPAPRL